MAQYQTVVNYSQLLQARTCPLHKHPSPICQVHMHFFMLGSRTGDIDKRKPSQITNINQLTEAYKICVSIVDLSVILIEALKTLVNRVFHF